jgi:uncharacterized protein YlxW (UPF0749 family)
MDATLSGETTAQAPKQTTKEYKSPPHALIWFFRKSRDLWKSKYQELQASIKRLKNRVADVTKSREQWKLKVEQTNNQLTVLEAENARQDRPPGSLPAAPGSGIPASPPRSSGRAALLRAW